MARYTRTPVSTLQGINNELAKVELAMEDTLDREGSGSNYMDADLDMNSRRILNLPAPVTDQEPLRKGDISADNTGASIAYVNDGFTSLRSWLMPMGYSGSFGFFEKGFTYKGVNDVGIDADGGAWTYTGSEAFPVEVVAGSSPNNSDYKKVIVRHQNKGGCYLIVDDVGSVQKSEVLPILDGSGFKFGMAPYLFGMESSYSVATMREILTLKKDNQGEILNHTSYSIALDDSMPLEVGESYVRAAYKQFNQFGFHVNGFVAPSSQLADKFRDVVVETNDYAFIRSYGNNSPVLVCNSPSDDMYNLARVSLESITLEKAKEYVDYAAANQLYICFYTHTDTGYLEDIIQYMKDSGLPNINPSEWVGSIKGLNKGSYPTSSGNMIINSSFERINTTSDTFSDGDEQPSHWNFDLGGIAGATAKILRGTPTRLDVNGIATVSGEEMKFTQTVSTGAIRDYTPFCFSVRITGAGTNAKVKLKMSLVDIYGGIIKEVESIQDARASEQLMYISEGFIPDATASYMEVSLSIISAAEGVTRAVFSEMQLEKSGLPTAFKSAFYLDTYFSQLRVTSGLTVQPNTDTKIVFNNVLFGTNELFDLATGEASPTNRENYRFTVNIGLKDMVAGDNIELYLLMNGSPARKSQHVCAAGDNIKSASWDVSANGTVYGFGIRHNSVSPRSLTSFSNAVLTVVKI